MGNKLSAVEVALKSAEGAKFQICHNCRGVEVEGTMIPSNYEHGREGELCCTQCENKRLRNIELKANKKDKKEAQRLKVEAAKTKIVEWETERGVLISAFFDWKEITDGELETTKVALESKGYHVDLGGDGAFIALISTKKAEKGSAEKLNNMENDFDELARGKELNTSVKRIQFSPNEFRAEVQKLLLA